jgi:hypothetical protein
MEAEKLENFLFERDRELGKIRGLESPRARFPR